MNVNDIKGAEAPASTGELLMQWEAALLASSLAAAEAAARDLWEAVARGSAMPSWPAGLVGHFTRGSEERGIIATPAVRA